MAELRDRLNRIVLHVDITDQEDVNFISNVRLVFQQNIFFNNDIGWRDEIQAELRWFKLFLIRKEVLDFIQAAQSWAKLPLSELAQTFFTGAWSLGENYSTERFELEFCPLYHTPTKTDGFMVKVDIVHSFRKTQEFESDYTSLVNFVNELAAECDRNES